MSGSLREGSINTAVLRAAAEVAPSDAATITYGGMSRLPHFNPDDDREAEPVDPEVSALRAALADADAVLICDARVRGRAARER